MSIASIDDLKRPPSLSLLAPVMNTEERPIIKIRTNNISWSFKEQNWSGSHWRC